MSNEAALETWRRYAATRDPKLREELAETHLPLVRFVASRMPPSVRGKVAHRDLVSYGVVGLLDAIDRYDPDSGFTFSTYAVHRIQGAMIDEMRTQAWEPRSVRERSRRLMDAIAELERRLGRTPGEMEVAEFLGIEVGEVRRIESDMRMSYVSSLNAPLRANSEDTQEVGDILAVEDSHLALEIKEVREWMAASIDTLPEEQRNLLEWVYKEGLSLRAIAAALQISESSASHLHTKAVVAMQRAMALRYN